MNKFNQKIRIAVQSSGRLREPSLEYLKSCGLKFTAEGRALIVACENEDMDVELIFVRNSDIPEYVRYNVADYGILGENVLMERDDKFDVVKKLGFGKCDLVLAVAEKSKFEKLEDLEHERIATSYLTTMKRILKQRKVSAAVVNIQGSVEICPALGLSDAIFDISQSGNTIRENGLRIIEKLAESQAVLIKNSNSNSQYEQIFL